MHPPASADASTESILNLSDLAIVTPALVTSRPNHWAAFYVGLPAKTIQKLQLAQNAAAWAVQGPDVVTGLNRCFSSSTGGPLVSKPSSSYKALQNLAPGHLKSHPTSFHTCPLRSAQEALLSQVRGVATGSKQALSCPSSNAQNMQSLFHQHWLLLVRTLFFMHCLLPWTSVEWALLFLKPCFVLILVFYL